MNKKAISEIIAWVLLIGMSVALAVLVTTWTKQYTKTATSSFLETVSGDLRCQDMAISANFTSPGNCNSITIMNRGYVKAADFMVRIDNTPYQLASGRNRTLFPDKSEDLNIQVAKNSKVEILPIVELEEGKRIACSDRKFTLAC